MQKNTLRKLKDSEGCAYPDCNEKVYKIVSMSIGKMNEFGFIEFVNGNKDIGNCSLCKYHYCFAEHKILNLVNQNGMIVLTAPWPMVELVENMIAAKDMFKKLNKWKRK